MRAVHTMGWMVLMLAANAAASAPVPVDRALHALREGAVASQSDAMEIVHDGQILAQYQRPGEPVQPIDMMSATKSVVALGIGLLLDDGRIRSLDQPVSDFYPQWRQGDKARITLRMLLNHTSGLQNVPSAVSIYSAPDAVQLALDAPLDNTPGTHFSYNNKAVNLLGGVIAKASGMPLDQFLQRRLFAPLGMKHSGWSKGERDQANHPYAMAGWTATVDDAARIGELVLADGRWRGRPLVSAQYIHEMVAPGQRFDPTCGLLWWRLPAWQRLQIDDASLSMLRAGGVPAAWVDELGVLRGRHFDSLIALEMAVVRALGKDFPQFMALPESRRVAPGEFGHARYGPFVAYAAEGDHGEYIVVVPRAHLVAVRQITAAHGRSGDGEAVTGYADFETRVLALAQTLAPDPAWTEH